VNRDVAVRSLWCRGDLACGRLVEFALGRPYRSIAGSAAGGCALTRAVLSWHWMRAGMLAVRGVGAGHLSGYEKERDMTSRAVADCRVGVGGRWSRTS